MAVRFPGPATTPVGPLHWTAWTSGRSSVRFAGAAAPQAGTALTWTAWTGAPEPAVQAAPARRPAPERPATPRPSAVDAPGTTQPVGDWLGLGELATAVARNQQAVTQAHQVYLQTQQAQLDAVAALHLRLAALGGS